MRCVASSRQEEESDSQVTCSLNDVALDVNLLGTLQADAGSEAVMQIAIDDCQRFWSRLDKETQKVPTQHAGCIPP